MFLKLANHRCSLFATIVLKAVEHRDHLVWSLKTLDLISAMRFSVPEICFAAILSIFSWHHFCMSETVAYTVEILPYIINACNNITCVVKNNSRHESVLYFVRVSRVRFAACGSIKFIKGFSPSDDQRHMYNMWTYTTDICTLEVYFFWFTSSCD